MFKVLIFACLLAFALAAPKPLSAYFSGAYGPAVGTYSAYSAGYPYAYGGGYYGYGASPYSSFYY